MNLLENRPWLREVRPEEIETLRRLAEDDNHVLLAASHVFLKGDQPVGYASLANIPLVLPWFHTTRCKPADSLYFINQMENLLAGLIPRNGQDLICVPFVAGSPFEPHMSRLGYTPLDKVTLAFKKVR